MKQVLRAEVLITRNPAELGSLISGFTEYERKKYENEKISFNFQYSTEIQMEKIIYTCLVIVGYE